MTTEQSPLAPSGSPVKTHCVQVGPPLVLVPQYFGSTVFDRRTSRYLPFDHETTRLLTRAQSVPFSVLIERAEPARRNVVEAFFRAFFERGFFTCDLHFDGEILDITPPPGHLTGPLAVHLEIVAACNLRCSHCFAGELPRKEPPLTLDELDRLFASLAKMGSYRLGLTGGEPLLRKDLFDILDLATDHGLCPCLTTNALLVTPEIAKKLGERRLVWLNVSLDGATRETNDAVRGEGTFDKVMEKIQILRQYARFSIAFTVMRHNKGEAAATAELAANLGAHTAVFRPLYPTGMALSSPELWPSFDDYETALDAVWTLGTAPDGREVVPRAIDPFSPKSRKDAQSVITDNWGCGAANTVCSISVGGDVSPCSFLGAEYASGNVRRQSIEEIWREGHRFRALRGLDGDGGRASFGGGCRARSLVLAGDVNAPDPWLTHHEEAPQRHNPLTVLRSERRLP